MHHYSLLFGKITEYRVASLQLPVKNHNVSYFHYQNYIPIFKCFFLFAFLMMSLKYSFLNTPKQQYAPHFRRV